MLQGSHNTLALAQADQMTKTGMANEIGLIAFLFQVGIYPFKPLLWIFFHTKNTKKCYNMISLRPFDVR